jgi:putative ABC transport system permease protein
MGRVKPGISMAQAQAETERLAGQLGALFPETFGKARLNFWPKVRRDARTRTVAAALQAVVAIVLLIACANVMNLLLARHQARRSEMATRMALGASRGRLTRQLLLESMALAVPSAVAGYGLAVLIISIVEKIPIPGIPDIKMYVYLDGTVFTYALCAAVLGTVIAGLWPARAAPRPDLVPALKDLGAAVGGRKFGLRGALVAAQLALSLVGITAAAMLTKSVLDLNPFDPGVDPHKVLAAGLWPAMSGYSAERSAEFRRQLISRVVGQPGVESLAFAVAMPGGESGAHNVIHTGSPLLPKQKTVMVRSNSVGPDYFHTLGIRILRGREYSEQDLSGRPLCLVNETMARRFWPGQEPLGQMVRVRTSKGDADYEVIGVARDTAYERSGDEYAPFLYLPLGRLDVLTLILRTNANAMGFAEHVRRAVASLDPEMPLLPVGALADNLIGGSNGTE